MIESITIANVASFIASPPETLSGLSLFNYFYGSNGTGKTTISRIIADESRYPDCTVSWKNGTKLKPKVYNRDFIDRVFQQSSELPGVFTLGEKQNEILAEIATAKRESDDLTAKIENLTYELHGDNGQGGKKGELTALEDDFKNKCWEQKKKYDAKLQGAFKGYRDSMEKFKTKILQEQESNTATLQIQADLEKKVESVFGPDPITEVTIPTIDTTGLIAHETNPILKRRVIGKGDVDIAAMIKKLGNSDWVREGRAFYNMNERTCPFCQQNTTEAFAQSLNEYFDKAFTEDSEAINSLATSYARDAAQIQQQLAEIITSTYKFLDIEKLKEEKKLFDTTIILNNQRLAEKKKEASQVVKLEPLTDIISSIKSIIDSANINITNHNNVIANLKTEQETLTAQVWRFVLEELKTDFSAFKNAKDDLNKAIESITTQIATAKKDKLNKTEKIREMEKQTTSIQPTVDGINAMLVSFGFQNFSLAKAENGTSYKLVRADGSDAKTTLSEGEKNFVTFLYFYHLLKGSESDSGMTENRIVVFDDPISSLDSNILFIVSSLIRELIEETRSKTGLIKQIFILTHNVYFHKEVTYNSKRTGIALNSETFWIVKKPDQISKVQKYQYNPIKSSYELLWEEVRSSSRSNLTIQNTLRRILENYFKFLGDIRLDQLHTKFEREEEKITCKSLCSWIQDGSHYVYDDLYVSTDLIVDLYLRIFKAIFEKTGHIAHYNMMMKIENKNQEAL